MYLQRLGSGTNNILALSTSDGTTARTSELRLHALGNIASTTNIAYLSLRYDGGATRYAMDGQTGGSGSLYPLRIMGSFELTESSAQFLSSSVSITGNRNYNPNTNPSAFLVASSIFTDTQTAESSSTPSWSLISLQQPTIASTNATVTTTSASTLWIEGPPLAGNNQTVGTAYSLQVANGTSIMPKLNLTNSTAISALGSIQNASVYSLGSIASVSNMITSASLLSNSVKSADPSTSLLISSQSDNPINFSTNNGSNTRLQVASTSVSVNVPLNVTDTTSTTTTNSGAIISSGGIAILSTVNSSSLTNGGSLVTLGGVAIGKTLRAHSAIIQSTTASTSASTGSLIVEGSVGIAGSLSLNGFNASSTTSVLSLQNYLGGTPATLEVLTSSNNLTQSVNVALTGRNDNATLLEQLLVGYDQGSDRFQVRTNYGASATKRNLTINNDASSLQFHPNGTMTVLSTNLSTSNSTGAFIVQGGLTIASTANSASTTVGNALTCYGGLTVAKDVYIGGTTYINQLSFLGEAQVITTTNTAITDNVIALNVSPSISRNTGFILSRYQPSNDSNLGDLSSDPIKISFTLPAQTGTTSTTVILSSGASASNDFYNNWYIRVNSQWRLITAYVGSTRLATVAQPWTAQPVVTDVADLFNRTNAVLLYREDTDEFTLGYSVSDASSQFVNLSELGNLSINALSTLGVSTMTGRLVVQDTTNSTSASSNSSIRTLGGLSVASDQYIGGSLNVISNANVTGNIQVTSTSLTSISTSGGLAVSKTINANATTVSTAYTVGAIVAVGGISTGDALTIGTASSQSISVFSSGDMAVWKNRVTTRAMISSYVSQDGDASTSVLARYYRLGGLPTDANTEWMEVGYNSGTSYSIASNQTGTGVSRPIVLQIGNTSSLQVTATTVSVLLTSTTAFSVAGGVAITSTTNSTSSSSGGALTVSGGCSVAKDLYVGQVMYTETISPSTSLAVSSTGSSSGLVIAATSPSVAYTNALSLFSRSSSESGNYEVLKAQTSGSGKYVIQSLNGGAGTLRSLALLTGSNTDQVLLNTDGTVTMSATQSSVSSSTGALRVSSLTCTNTTNATSTTGGSLSVYGGCYIDKDTVINGNLVVNGAVTNSSQYTYFPGDFSLTVTSISNVGSATSLNGVRTIDGTSNQTVFSISIVPTAANTKTIIEVALPGRTTAFANAYDLIGTINGYEMNLNEALENMTVFGSTSNGRARITFTSADAVSNHIVQIRTNYSSS